MKTLPVKVGGEGEAVYPCVYHVGKTVAKWKILGCIFSGKNGSLKKKKKKRIVTVSAGPELPLPLREAKFLQALVSPNPHSQAGPSLMPLTYRWGN